MKIKWVQTKIYVTKWATSNLSPKSIFIANSKLHICQQCRKQLHMNNVDSGNEMTDWPYPRNPNASVVFLFPSPPHNSQTKKTHLTHNPQLVHLKYFKFCYHHAERHADAINKLRYFCKTMEQLSLNNLLWQCCKFTSLGRHQSSTDINYSYNSDVQLGLLAANVAI